MSILFLGDYKDHASRVQRKDYADGNGRLFWHLLYSTGINVRDIEFRYCRDQSFDPQKYKIVVPLGQEALRSLDDGNIRKVRGSVLGDGKPWIIPTLHPRDLKKPFDVFRESQIETSQLVYFDLEKVRRVYEEGFTKPREDFILEPTLEDLEAFVAETRDVPYLGVDIEGTGLNLDYTDIVCIGFASSRERCLVVPLRTSGGVSYWPVAQQERVDGLLRELLSKRKLLFQNGYGYDVPLLRRHGYNIPWENFHADTMLVHHALDPELPHNIGFISSVWGHQPYWKEGFLSRKEHIYDTDQLEMRRYNARDCTALIDIYEAMLPEVERRGVQHIVDLEHRLIPAIITMRERGLVKDVSKVASWQSWLRQELSSNYTSLVSDFDLPETFNLSSQDHMNWLLYGVSSKGMEKKMEELKTYDQTFWQVQYACLKCGRKKNVKYPGNSDSSGDGQDAEDIPCPATVEAKCSTCRQNMPHSRTDKAPSPVKAKSRETKKYQELFAVSEVLAVPPLTKPSAFRPTRTSSGKLGTGREDIARFQNAILKRQEQIDGLVNPRAKADELAGLERTGDFLGRFSELAKLIKLKASFFDLPTGTDGRVHPQVLIQGTATGRFSCVNPNAQQMPNAKSMAGGKVRDLFKAPEGFSLVSVD